MLARLGLMIAIGAMMAAAALGSVTRSGSRAALVFIHLHWLAAQPSRLASQLPLAEQFPVPQPQLAPIPSALQ